MASVSLAPAELIERRYLGLVRLAGNVAEASDWNRLAASISQGLADPLDECSKPPPVRVWAILSEGFEELARHPGDHPFQPAHQRDLQRAAMADDPVEIRDGALLVGLRASSVSLGVIEVDSPTVDGELLSHCAPIVACQMSVLAGQGIGDVLIAPSALASGSDAAPVMAQFATEAKRLLEHDRLSAYLLSHDGRAFERFAVATSPIIPGEGVIIPFEDVGLRHIVLTNRALVSDDLATDPRIVGREDRVIAGAGFHGLLSVPLRRDGRPFGVLNFVSRTPGFYRDDDIPVAQQVADQISAFVENVYVERRMRTLTSHEAADRERVRVARDVYHAIGQTVPEIDAAAAKLADRLAAIDEEGAQQAQHVRELARLELAEVRRAIAGLVPQALDAHSLEDAIELVLARLGDDPRDLNFTVTGSTAGLSPAASRAAFRIFQEALTNARLHAGARRIDIEVKVGRDLELVVSDDGVGFDADAVDASVGMGLQFMRERAQALGGTVCVQSSPGKGAIVRLELLGACDATEQPRATDDARAPGTPTLRVFVIEGSPLVRSGLIRLVERSGDMRLAGAAASADEAKGQLRGMRPDVIVLDAELAAGEAGTLLQEVRRELPSAAILALSDRDPARAELSQAGAAAVVGKNVDGDELLDLLRAVAEGKTVEPAPEPAVATDGAAGGVLTARECSILALVAAGDTNNEIGKELFLATKTVERHVATIVRKLAARNRAHAAAVAIARGLVELPQR